MMNTTNFTLLEAVIAELQAAQGSLVQLADDTGIPYDTILRIKNRENDPGYSRVQQLADHLGVSCVCAVPPAPTIP